MSVPNVGPAHPEPGEHDAADSVRRGNPALVYRDEPITDDVAAASARASTVTHRFGGVRYALSRPGNAAAQGQAPTGEEDEPEERP